MPDGTTVGEFICQNDDNDRVRYCFATYYCVEEWMLQGLYHGYALGWVHHQALADQVLWVLCGRIRWIRIGDLVRVGYLM